MTKTIKCPRGKIPRVSYTRKAYIKSNGIKVKKTIVPSVCIKDLGNKGKGPKLFTLKKGELGSFGYKLKLKADQRRKSLKKASKKFEKNTLIKKLNALSILQKNTNPINSRKAKYDMKWVQKNI
jgi:hypothetical protein